MEKINVETLEDAVLYVQEHLLPEIQHALEVCVKSYLEDEFNDTYTFGTHFWKNTWNRFETVTKLDDCPFELEGKRNEYKLKIGPYVLRHHRINKQSKLPNGARAAKSSADYKQMVQLKLFGDQIEAPEDVENIVLAIDADIKNGLKEVFLGEIIPLDLESKRYRWAKKVPVFLADGIEGSTAEIVQFEDMPGLDHYAPEEEIVEVPVTLDKSIANPKEIESEGDK